MVQGGLEPPTLALWVLRSNQLSYSTIIYNNQTNGGESGIRTRGTIARTTR